MRKELRFIVSCSPELAGDIQIAIMEMGGTVHGVSVMDNTPPIKATALVRQAEQTLKTMKTKPFDKRGSLSNAVLSHMQSLGRVFTYAEIKEFILAQGAVDQTGSLLSRFAGRGLIHKVGDGRYEIPK